MPGPQGPGGATNWGDASVSSESRSLSGGATETVDIKAASGKVVDVTELWISHHNFNGTGGTELFYLSGSNLLGKRGQNRILQNDSTGSGASLKNGTHMIMTDTEGFQAFADNKNCSSQNWDYKIAGRER